MGGGGGGMGAYSRGVLIQGFMILVYLSSRRFWRIHKFMSPRGAKRPFSVFSFKVRKTLAP